jgi:plasmid stabilization system protein ParE
VFRIRWAQRAAQDFESALAYIAADDPKSAAKVRGRILATLKQLESFSLGLPAPHGAWKLYIPKTPYFIVFRRDETAIITIRAFVHASRDWEMIDWENM